MQQIHDTFHRMSAGWAHIQVEDWCGRCQLGNDLWSRYAAGLVQPIAPADVDIDSPAESIIAAAQVRTEPELPSLPMDGFIRAAKQRKEQDHGNS